MGWLLRLRAACTHSFSVQHWLIGFKNNDLNTTLQFRHCKVNMRNQVQEIRFALENGPRPPTTTTMAPRGARLPHLYLFLRRRHPYFLFFLFCYTLSFFHLLTICCPFCFVDMYFPYITAHSQDSEQFQGMTKFFCWATGDKR